MVELYCKVTIGYNPRRAPPRGRQADPLRIYWAGNHEWNVPGGVHTTARPAAQAHAMSESLGFTSGRMASMLNNMAVALRLYPIVTFQYCSTTLYQVSYHIR